MENVVEMCTLHRFYISAINGPMHTLWGVSSSSSSTSTSSRHHAQSSITDVKDAGDEAAPGDNAGHLAGDIQGAGQPALVPPIEVRYVVLSLDSEWHILPKPVHNPHCG